MDQWRGDCLGHLGHTVETPALDGLAADGVSFTRHFAQAAPCGPSRASLYTGTYLMTHRSVGNGTPLDDRFTNIAREARAMGYEPALFGYTDTSLDPATLSADDPRLRSYESVLPGFDVVCDLPEGNPRPWLDWLVAQGVPVPREWQRLDDPTAQHPGLASGYDFEHSQTAFLTQAALDWIERQHAPWFAHLSYLRPHPPFVATSPYHELYSAEDLAAPTRAATRAQEAEIHPLMAALVRHPLTAAPDDDELAVLRTTYHGMQTEVDAWLGRLFAELRALRRWDDTLVVVTSDHGEQLGDHWCAGKLAWFDESYHVPLVIRDPREAARATRGTLVTSFTEHVDVMPTILEALAIPTPPQCDGRPLTGFLTGDVPDDWRREVHFEFDFRDPQNPNLERHFESTPEEVSLTVLRDEHGKYVHFGGQALPPLFFDLDDDPDMLVDRSTDPGRAATVLDYAQRQLSWRMRHADRRLANVKLSPLGVVERHGERR